MKNNSLLVHTTSHDQAAIERMLVASRMKNFDPNHGRVIETLTNLLGTMPNREQLLSLGRVLAKHLHLQLDREAFRRKEVLIKWFDEHFEVVIPFITHHIKIETVEKQKEKKQKRKK